MTNLRITTWNCNSSGSIKYEETANRTFQDKSKYLDEFDSDISVFQEISKPYDTKTPNMIWRGGSFGRGIAVKTNQSYQLETSDEFLPSRSALPVRVVGKQRFNLLALWSRPLKDNTLEYVKEVISNVKNFRNFLEGAPSVIIGDFNSNSIWNGNKNTANHAFLIDLLEKELNLKSCYHSYFQVEQGKELHPTIYWYRHLDKPYHVDYCFVPENWKIENVKVGTHENWANKSDHCPLTVDLKIY